MKIKSLQIDSYRHLQNLHLDFTYPAGHPTKAGQPLDKICIIGQSATGKTGLLELVRDSLKMMKTIEVINGTDLIFRYYRQNFAGTLEYQRQNEQILLLSDKIVIGEKEYKHPDGGGGGVIDFLFKNIKLLYFSAEAISKDVINIFNKNPQEIFMELAKADYSTLRKFTVNNYFFEFLQEISLDLWLSLLSEVLEYRSKFTQMASELIHKGAIGDLSKLNREYAKWAKENPNPLEAFAKMFNPILRKLNLEVDLVNTEYSIPIKSHSKDEVIPISGLSTGTKGLLLSMFPLYELDTNDAIILIDEPERSLYPDMQIDLMKQYGKLAKNAQFLVATHSPMIASSFDPWEIVELKFDANGNVYRELYYEGENHVDNYKYNPRYMRWDDILQRIFDMENDGSEDRKEKLDELAFNNVKYKNLQKQDQSKTEEGVKVLQEIQTLSKALSTW